MNFRFSLVGPHERSPLKLEPKHGGCISGSVLDTVSLCVVEFHLTLVDRLMTGVNKQWNLAPQGHYRIMSVNSAVLLGPEQPTRIGFHFGFSESYGVM